MSWFRRKSQHSAQKDESSSSTSRGFSTHSLYNQHHHQGYTPSHTPPAQLLSAYPPAYQVLPPRQDGTAADYYNSVENPNYVVPPQNRLNHHGSFPLPTANPSMSLEDDPYSFLAEFDTIFLIDDSGSMRGERWDQTARALLSIIPITTYYDKDGVDLYFLNHKDHPSHFGIDKPQKLMEIFTKVVPRHATPTGTRLNAILKPYIAKLAASPNNVKPLNIIVITDGVPTDDVESVIIQNARKLDKMDADLTQVGIQFFQIGDDAAAAEALRELDDNLGGLHDIRDMVDTVPWTGGDKLEGDRMLKIVLGAVNKRLDRKRLT